MVLCCVSIKCCMTVACGAFGCVCSGQFHRPHSQWNECIESWFFTLDSLAQSCSVPDHVMDELIVSIQYHPKKSWRLHSLMTRCGIDVSISEAIMSHIEHCLEA